MSSVYRAHAPPPYEELLHLIDSLINWVPYLDLRSWALFSGSLKLRILVAASCPPVMITIRFIAAFVGQLRHVRNRHPPVPLRQVPLKVFLLALFELMPFAVFVAFFVAIPISSFAFLSLRECECFVLQNESGTPYDTLCFSPMDYSLRCPPSYGKVDFRDDLPPYLHHQDANQTADEAEFNSMIVVAYGTVVFYAALVPFTFGFLLWMARRGEINGVQTHLSHSLSFLYNEYRDGYYWWELLVTVVKLWLVGFLSLSYFSPGHPLQLLSALVISLGYQMLIGWCHPYRKPGLNLLAVFSAASLQFIFLAFLCFELSGASTAWAH